MPFDLLLGRGNLWHLGKILVEDISGNVGQWKTTVCRGHDPWGHSRSRKSAGHLERRHHRELRACRRSPNRKCINALRGGRPWSAPFPNWDVANICLLSGGAAPLLLRYSGEMRSGFSSVSKRGRREHFLAFGWRSAFGAAIQWQNEERLQPLRCLMAAPCRGNTGYGCYFIIASTFQKRNILQSDRMADLFVDVLLHYRAGGKYLLHEFVMMPDHFHLLITPHESLERAMQLIKGGFSFRAKRELGFTHEIWQPSFYDRRVRNAEEYFAFRDCIRQNPRKRGLTTRAEEYRYSSAWPGMGLDEAPQRLKPLDCMSA